MYRLELWFKRKDQGMADELLQRMNALSPTSRAANGSSGHTERTAALQRSVPGQLGSESIVWQCSSTLRRNSYITSAPEAAGVDSAPGSRVHVVPFDAIYDGGKSHLHIDGYSSVVTVRSAHTTSH